MAEIQNTVNLPVEEEEPTHHNTYMCGSYDLRFNRKATPAGGLEAVIGDFNRLWDNGQTITYTFIEPAGTHNQQEKTKQVLKEWKNYVNLDFKYVASHNAMLRITFNNNEGSFSYIGRDNIDPTLANKKTMNLGWMGRGAAILPEDRRIVLHEFGHAIGYRHEHQSTRRGELLRLKEDVVIEAYKNSQGWSEDDVRKQVLNVYDDDLVSSTSTMDPSSIMMYSMTAEWNTQGVEIPRNYNLSDLDKAFGVINYPYIDKPSPDPSWTVERALDVAGVDGDFRDNILKEYASKDWRGMRQEFSYWSLEQRARAFTNTADAPPQ